MCREIFRKINVNFFFTGTILLHCPYILYMPPKADFIMANVARVSGVANGPLVIMLSQCTYLSLNINTNFPISM